MSRLATWNFLKTSMRKIPEKLKKEILSDPDYKTCTRKDHDCDGRITWEHAIIYAGKQLNEKWAIIPLCAYHHSVDFHQDGDGLNKEINVWIALNRATDFELSMISKVIPYLKERARLNAIHGVPTLFNPTLGYPQVAYL